jgi:hypothetical protein
LILRKYDKINDTTYPYPAGIYGKWSQHWFIPLQDAKHPHPPTPGNFGDVSQTLISNGRWSQTYVDLFWGLRKGPQTRQLSI